MLKIRRPLGLLIFNMGIAIPGKTVFLIETAPRSPVWFNTKKVIGATSWEKILFFHIIPNLEVVMFLYPHVSYILFFHIIPYLEVVMFLYPHVSYILFFHIIPYLEVVIFLYPHVSYWVSLTHWGGDKMSATSQTTFSNAFSWMTNVWISIKMSLKFVPNGPINHI